MRIEELVAKYGICFAEGAAYEGVSLSKDDFLRGADLALLKQYPTLADYQTAFPVGQDFHTGKWGYGRHAGGLDLNTCRYPAKLYAEKVRDTRYLKVVSRG